MAHPLITTSTSKREERFASPPSAAANGNSVRPDIVLDMYHQPRVSPSYNAGGSDSPATGSDVGSGGVSATALVMPEPEGPDGSTRTHVIDMLDQSRTRWLKNTEVCDMLLNHRSYGFALSKTAPVRPPGASSVRPKFLSPSFSARPAGDFRPSDEAGGARVAAGFAREPDRARPSRRATVSGERIRARNSSSALHPDDPRA